MRSLCRCSGVNCASGSLICGLDLVAFSLRCTLCQADESFFVSSINSRKVTNSTAMEERALLRGSHADVHRAITVAVETRLEDEFLPAPIDDCRLAPLVMDVIMSPSISNSSSSLSAMNLGCVDLSSGGSRDLCPLNLGISYFWFVGASLDEDISSGGSMN